MIPYKLASAADVIRTTDGACIPADPTLSLADVKAVQTAVIDAACQASIYAGFTSSALGAAYRYPAKDKDQQNLSASVIDAIVNAHSSDWTTPFWCADAAGIWSFRPHTADQIIQVGKDGKAAITVALTQCAALQAAIKQAATPSDVQAVAWPSSPSC